MLWRSHGSLLTFLPPEAGNRGADITEGPAGRTSLHLHFDAS